ncbi:YdeI/OmpD-associated family protein [Chloroflexota bacterium]
MPDFVGKALVERGLMDAYLSRPPYQRNDYLSWITRAKQEKIRHRRLNQMLDELVAGDSYMKMKYKPKRL